MFWEHSWNNDLQNTRKTTVFCIFNQKFLSCFLTLKEAQSLRVGDKIDHRDVIGKFSKAEIISKNGNVLKIHYIGWTNTYDVYSNYNNEIHRFASYNSLSSQTNFRKCFDKLCVGSAIDFNTSCSDNTGYHGWIVGTIKQFDDNSGQVLIQYRISDKRFSNYKVRWLWWSHLNNINELAVVNSKIRNERYYDIVRFWYRKNEVCVFGIVNRWNDDLMSIVYKYL